MRVTLLERKALGSSLGRFGRDDSAATAIIFALALPVMLGAAGIAVDYSIAASTRTKMQTLADSAAVNAARGLQMAKMTPEIVAANAKAYVKNEMKDVDVSALVDDKALTVNVVIEKNIALTIGKYLWSGTTHVRTSATAKLNASLPLCLLALDPKAAATLSLEKSASLAATGCTV